MKSTQPDTKKTEAHKNAENPLTYLFRKMWRYSEGNRKSVVYFWVMFVIAGIIELLVGPFVWAKVMDIIQIDEGVNQGNIYRLIGLLSLLLVTTVVFWALHGPARVMERINAFKVRLNYRKYLLKGILNLPMDWHSSRQSGDIIDKVEKGTSAMYEFSAVSFEMIYLMIKLLGSFIMLAYLFPPAAILMFFMMWGTVWLVTKIDKRLMVHYRELNKSENQISAAVYDAIGNINTVIILRVERALYNAIINKAEKPLALFKENNVVNEKKWFSMSACCTFMVIVVVGAYLIAHVGKSAVVMSGSIYLLYSYLDRVKDVFSRFTQVYSDIVRRKAAVMNSEELAADFQPENFANHVLPPDWKTLQISNLRFLYENGDNGVHLDGMNMDIARGDRLAFVGASGSGKSTLLMIMRGLFKPQRLSLSVDGKAVPEGFDGIARAMSLIPQASENFAATIGENITLGVEYPKDKVLHYARMADFADVAERLPHGFDSIVNENGVNFSGGEQQRLSLTRGLLACEDKDIVLLDEPTSAQDVRRARDIYRRIFEEFKGKTIISAIHQLHLLHFFDKIYFFEKGKGVTAHGTFDELLTTCPAFQKMWLHYTQSEEQN